MEREVVELKDNELQDGFYPLKSLLAGVAWPSDVDPSKREQYLSPSEFEKTFGMTKVGCLSLVDTMWLSLYLLLFFAGGI